MIDWQGLLSGLLIALLSWSANRARKLFKDVDIAFEKIRAIERDLKGGKRR